MSGLTETVRVMVRGPYGTDDNLAKGAAETVPTEEVDEMGEPVIVWTPVDVPGCLVRPKYRDADADAVGKIRPDAAELTVYVAMNSKDIDFTRLRGAKLRFPDRFGDGDIADNELNVVGMPWPTPQSPLDWDLLVEAEAQHG